MADVMGTGVIASVSLADLLELAVSSSEEGLEYEHTLALLVQGPQIGRRSSHCAHSSQFQEAVIAGVEKQEKRATCYSAHRWPSRAFLPSLVFACTLNSLPGFSCAIFELCRLLHFQKGLSGQRPAAFQT